MTIAAAVFHAGVTLAIGLGVIRTLRWMATRSGVISMVVGLGVAGRLLVAVALFWASYFQFAPLQSLHTGDGFWRLAPDAPGYFLRAAAVWDPSGSALEIGTASPSYVRLLSYWMLLAGRTVPGAALLNVAAYLASCVLIVVLIDPRRGRPQALGCGVSVAALTFSPASVIFGSQSLKDAPFAFLLVATCVALLALLGEPSRFRRSWVATATLATVWCGVAAFVVAGMRSYFPLLQTAAVLPALGARFWSLRGAAVRVTYGLTALALLAVTWMGFESGAGVRYDTYECLLLGDRTGACSRVENARKRQSTVAGALDSYREGFVRAGGATNVVWIGWGRPAAAGPDEPVSGAERVLERAVTVASGLTVMFVPISLLRLAGLVDFAGGRGLLAITDIDTVYLAVSFVAVAFVMGRCWWPGRRNFPYVVFSVGLALLLAVLMAYVVTNFGTLFRLRLMVATLIWVTPLALWVPAPVDHADGTRERTALEPGAPEEPSFEPLVGGGAAR